MKVNKKGQMDKEEDVDQLFIMRETQECVIITKDGKKLFVNYINENLRRVKNDSI